MATSLGGVAFALGVVIVGMAGLCIDECHASRPGVNEARLVGAVVGLGGAALLATGIVLVVTQRTRIDLTEQSILSPQWRLGRGVELGRDGIAF